MNTETLIKEIHASDAFGCFIEAGCGTAVSSKLFEVAGSSNTIFVAESPYNKEYQRVKYNSTIPVSNCRAVSCENVQLMMRYWVNQYRSTCNTFYVSTFQVGDNTNSKSTHGWIGLRVKNEELYYHVSIHKAMSRKEYIDVIGMIGLKIIYSRIFTTLPSNFAFPKTPSDCCIDIAKFKVDGGSEDVSLGCMFDMLADSKDENFICINTDGNLVRMEDLFRETKGIIIYKGSFHPVHHGHLTVVNLVEKKYGDPPVFMISSEVYQKDNIPSAEIERRVEMINSLGYSVIVTKNGYFNKNVEYIRNKFHKKPIIFVVGTDTINRIADSSYSIIGEGMINRKDFNGELEKFKTDFYNVRFFVVNRPGYKLAPEITKHLNEFHDVYDEAIDISSSKIRKLMEEGNHDKIKELVPTKVYESLIKLKQTI